MKIKITDRFEISGDLEGTSLNSLRNKLADWINLYGESATISVSASGGGSWSEAESCIEICVTRQETDLEEKTREDRQKKYDSDREASQRALYEQMKKKFEGK